MRRHADFIKKFTASYRAYEGEDIVPWQVLIGNVAAVSLVISVWMHLHYKLYRLSKVQAKLGFGSRTGDHGDRRIHRRLRGTARPREWPGTLVPDVEGSRCGTATAI
ncbi:hypothetical protein [Rhizobium leguminosarum]|uniref:hypothetical protein n=1 Tax=Rhizobium leguminosarum TaxID=384 RepID=UPI001FD98794|nr:hypothetical protein [Rhizobium leguminosarum]